MIKTFKSAFDLVRNNIVVVQPLVFYLLIFGVVSNPISLDGTFSYASILAIITLLLTTSAFFAGWFYIVKAAISMKDKEYETPEEKSLAQFDLLKQFFTGVGEYFIPILLSFVIYLSALLLISFLSYKLGLHYLGKVILTPELIKASKTGEYKDFLAVWSSVESIKAMKLLSYWGVYLSSLSILFSLVTMYYGATILYDTKNPIVALINNFKFLFKNFFGSLFIMLFLTFLNFILVFLNLMFAQSFILSLIVVVLLLFYYSYQVMLIFLYYEQKAKSNSDSGAECIGQIESGD